MPAFSSTAIGFPSRDKAMETRKKPDCNHPVLAAARSPLLHPPLLLPHPKGKDHQVNPNRLAMAEAVFLAA